MRECVTVQLIDDKCRKNNHGNRICDQSTRKQRPHEEDLYDAMNEKIGCHEMLGSEGEMPCEVTECIRNEIAGILRYLILREKSDDAQNDPRSHRKERYAANELQKPVDPLQPNADEKQHFARLVPTSRGTLPSLTHSYGAGSPSAGFLMRLVNHRFLAPIAAAVAFLGLASIGPATAAPGFFDLKSTAAHVAQDRVNDALTLVQQVKENPVLAAALWRAEGVFIIPQYGKGDFIVGGQGGDGVLLIRRHSRWTSPAFYSLSGGSTGGQAAGEGGAVIMILMTRRAVYRFESSIEWSLNGNAGLTMVNSADAQMDSIYYQAAGDTDRDPHGQRQQPQCRQAP